MHYTANLARYHMNDLVFSAPHGYIHPLSIGIDVPMVRFDLEESYKIIAELIRLCPECRSTPARTNSLVIDKAALIHQNTIFGMWEDLMSEINDNLVPLHADAETERDHYAGVIEGVIAEWENTSWDDAV
jgi:hypothetical protein